MRDVKMDINARMMSVSRSYHLQRLLQRSHSQPNQAKPKINKFNYHSFSAQCCWRGNLFKNCFWCIYPFNCYSGKYCYTLTTPPPTTTPKPTTCKNDYNCPSGYKCEYEICVPIPTTTLKPTPPKPRKPIPLKLL